MLSQKCGNVGSKPKCGISRTIAGRLTPIVKLGSSSRLRCCFRQRSSGVVSGLLESVSTFISFRLFRWPTHFYKQMFTNCHLIVSD